MSKIENALRLERDKVEGPGGASHSNRNPESRFSGSRYNTNLPIVLNIEPHPYDELDQKVLARNRIICDDYPEPALTSYKMLRTRVLQKMTNNNWRVIGVTSPRDGAGKTMTAVNLAIAMASHGAHDVFLLDLDLKSPDVGRRLGLPSFELDLGEYLAGRLPVSRVCCEVDGLDHLQIMPSSQIQRNSSELITSETMKGLLHTVNASSKSPIVIIDLPAVLAADDALAISPLIDGFLVVSAESQTSRDDLMRSLEMLSESEVLGIVLNKSKGK